MLLKHYKLNEHEQKLRDMSDVEFNDYMMKTYPEMFKNRLMKEDQTIIYPMNFGFEIGPGWRHVLDSLCKRLKIFQDTYGVVTVFDQIKEKYGSARFYSHCEMQDGKEWGNDSKDVSEIIDDLVHLYEEYTDYVCEELGTNVHPENKIQMGTWMYGMGIEGFEKWEREFHPDACEDRIHVAKEYLKRVERKKEIRDKMYYFSMDELERIDKMVNDISEERKARRDAM